MTAVAFVLVAAVIVVAGVRLARYGDVIGQRSGLGRSWVGLVLLAATTSLPELFAGLGATAVANLPDIALGDVFGSCLFNLLILSMVDALQPEPISARAHQGHALALGFCLLLLGVAGLGLVAGPRAPAVAAVGVPSIALIGLYAVAMRVLFRHEQQRLAGERREVAEELAPADATLRSAVVQYAIAAVLVVGAALWLPSLAARLADETGLGQAFVGSLLVACTTSLPEVVVSLAAVRLGAVDLAVGNVLGSNLFNLLVLGLDDVAYRRGPLLAASSDVHVVTVLAAMTMTALFLVAVTYRAMTKRFAVSWDTGGMIVVYIVAIWLVGGH